MASRRQSTVHQEAVARRLAQLSEQLAAGRPEPAEIPAEAGSGDEEDEWWSDHTRVRAARPPLALVPAPPAEPSPASAPTSAADGPVLLRESGRHASRRAAAWAELLPETLRGRVRLGPNQVAVVAVLIALGLAVTAWWAVRGRADPPVPVSMPVSAPVSGLVPATLAASAVPGLVGLVSPGVTAPAAPTGRSASTTVTVDVAGKVRRPGIVVLDSGARVVDALERAGGARPRVDLTTLNLARPLVDGEQILVGVVAPAIALGDPSGTGAPAAAGVATPTTPVDLNTATETDLETLPDVGPVTAGSIIAWRTDHGAFTSVSELLEVDGIGDATLAKLTPLVTV